MQGDQGSILLQRPAHNVPPNVSVACLDNVLDSLFSQVLLRRGWQSDPACMQECPEVCPHDIGFA